MTLVNEVTTVYNCCKQLKFCVFSLQIRSFHKNLLYQYGNVAHASCQLLFL